MGQILENYEYYLESLYWWVVGENIDIRTWFCIVEVVCFDNKIARTCKCAIKARTGSLLDISPRVINLEEGIKKIGFFV